MPQGHHEGSCSRLRLDGTTGRMAQVSSPNSPVTNSPGLPRSLISHDQHHGTRDTVTEARAGPYVG